MKRVNIIGTNGKQVTLVTPSREDVSKLTWLPSTVAFPVFFNEDPADILDQMTRTVKGGEGSGNFDHAGRPGERGGSAPASAHPGRVWAGKQHEGEATLNKLETGSIGEHAVIDALSQLYGVEFGTVNVNVNNAPFDVAGDSLAVEVKTGLATNGSGAHHWRATIGQPGKAETELLKQMSPEEKRAHNERKTQAILERKYGMLKKMSDEAGHPIKPMTVGLILRGDGKAADIYTFEGFHLRLPWSKYATDDYYLGTYDVENKVMHWKDAPTKALQFGKTLSNLPEGDKPTEDQPQSDLLERALAAALAEVDQDFEQVYQWWREHVDSTEGTIKGGRGSGNFGHIGRPGRIGGSAPQGNEAPKWRVVKPDPKPKPTPMLRPQPKPTPVTKTPLKAYTYLNAKEMPWLPDYEAKLDAFLKEAETLPDPNKIKEELAANKTKLLTSPVSMRHEIRKEELEIEARLEETNNQERRLFLKHFGEPFKEHAFIKLTQGAHLYKMETGDTFTQAHNFMGRVVSNWPWDDMGEHLPVNVSLEPERTRASYSDELMTVRLNDKPVVEDIIHEEGHFLEHRGFTYDGESIKQAVGRFFVSRTGGEATQRLSEVMPKYSFRPGEVTKTDHFMDAYMGKLYPDGSTEIISTGLQAFYQQPIKFAKADKEHFLVTLLAAKGKLR